MIDDAFIFISILSDTMLYVIDSVVQARKMESKLFHPSRL